MSDQEIKAAFTAGTANAPTQEMLDKFAADMRSKGLDPSQTLAKHAVQQQSGDIPPPQSRPVKLDINPATGVRSLTSEETLKGADQLRKFWSGDPAVLEAALEGAGVPKVEAPADTRTDAERNFDSSSLGAGAPEEYELNGLWLGRDAELHDAATTTGAIRTAFSALSVPKAVGLGFAEAMLNSREVTADLAEMSQAAQETWHIQQRVDFAKIARVQWSDAAAQMRPWLDRLPAATREFLSGAGAFNSVTAMVRLYSTFQLVQARAGMGKKS
jgi:hypothetical protein